MLRTCSFANEDGISRHLVVAYCSCGEEVGSVDAWESLPLVTPTRTEYAPGFVQEWRTCPCGSKMAAEVVSEEQVEA
jgi:hypothetical protein